MQDIVNSAPVETTIETYLESENKHLDLVYQEEFLERTQIGTTQEVNQTRTGLAP